MRAASPLGQAPLWTPESVQTPVTQVLSRLHRVSGIGHGCGGRATAELLRGAGAAAAVWATCTVVRAQHACTVDVCWMRCARRPCRGRSFQGHEHGPSTPHAAVCDIARAEASPQRLKHWLVRRSGGRRYTRACHGDAQKWISTFY